MGVSRKLLSNTFYLFLDYAMLLSSSIIFWIIAGKFLNREEFGIASTTINFLLLVSGTILFGTQSAIVKLISEFYGGKKHEKTQAVIGYVLRFGVIVGLFTTAFLLFFSNFFSKFFKIPTQTFIISVSMLTLVILYALSGPILMGFQDMRKFIFASILANPVKIAVSILLIFFGFAHLGLILGFLVWATLLAAQRIQPEWFKFRRLDRQTKKALFEYSKSAFLASFSSSLFDSLPNLTLSSMKNQKAVGTFEISLTYTSPIPVFISTICSALLPIISQLSVNKKTKETQSFLLQTVLKYSILVVVPMSLFISFFSRFIIIFLSNPDFLPATQIFPLMCIGSIFFGLQSLFAWVLYAMKKPSVLQNISFFRLIIFFPLLVLLTYPLSYLGVSIAYAISGFLTFIIILRTTKKYIKLEFPILSIVKVLVSSSVLLLIFFISDVITVPFLLKIGVALLGIIFYFILLVPLKFYSEQDILLLDLIAKKLPFFKTPLNFLAKLLSKWV